MREWEGIFRGALKEEDFKPSHIYDFQADANGVIRLNDRDNNVSFDTTEDFDKSSVKKEFHLMNGDFVKALRSYKSAGIKFVVVSVSDSMVKFEAMDGGSAYLLALPQRSIHGYKTDEIEMVSAL